MSDREEFEKAAYEKFFDSQAIFNPDLYKWGALWIFWQAAAASMQAKLDALDAENARLKAALNSQWQPIETAPKDGKYYLFYRTSEIQSAKWLGNTWGDYGWCYQMPENVKNGFTDSLPTHWMTLPEAPIARDALKGE